MIEKGRETDRQTERGNEILTRQSFLWAQSEHAQSQSRKTKPKITLKEDPKEDPLIVKRRLIIDKGRPAYS